MFKNLINLLSYIISVMLFANISVLKINLGNIYYAIMIIVLLILIVIGKRPKVNPWFAFLLLSGFLSIYLNEIPTFFKSDQRFLSFTILISLLSPLFTSTLLNVFRYKLLLNIVKINIVVVLFSFLGIVLGLPLMTGRGGFTGFFNHSMTLGPMAAISMLTCLYLSSFQVNKYKRFSFYVLASISFITCVASGSRGSLVAAVFGALVYFYKINQGKFLKQVKALLVVIFLSTISFPFWEQYTERLVGKMEYADSNGSLVITRESLWLSRIAEFEQSPIFGIGFASVDISNDYGFDKETGKIEPGSSLLAVLSMLGVFGAIPLFVIIYRYALLLFKTKTFQYRLGYYAAILTFFIIHMITEGYIFSTGSGLFLLFWLSLGNIEMYSNFFNRKNFTR